MTGTCQKCGCTSERACEGGCFWIDSQRDLCSRCARALFCGPIGHADAELVIRAMRSALTEMGARMIELEQLVMHLSGDEVIIEAGAEPVIWTPENIAGDWFPRETTGH